MAALSPLLQQATPIVAARGEGAYLWDESGRRFLDFTSGIAVTSTGHCHPVVVEAIRRQAGTLIHGQYTTVLHRPLLELTERLGSVLPPSLDAVFYANAGTEAIEAAVRLARQTTGRPVIVTFQGGFHGRTMVSASLTTSRAAIRSGMQPLMGGVVVAPRTLDHARSRHTHPRHAAPVTTRQAAEQPVPILVARTRPPAIVAASSRPAAGERRQHSSSRDEGSSLAEVHASSVDRGSGVTSGDSREAAASETRVSDSSSGRQSSSSEGLDSSSSGHDSSDDGGVAPTTTNPVVTVTVLTGDEPSDLGGSGPGDG